MIKQSDVVVIVPHLGADKQQEYAFDECYASLKESVPDMRILVAKNGPACPHIRSVRVLIQGQCKAVNAAVAITNEPWIMVTNDDMIYPPGWFEKLTSNLPKDVWCVSPQLVEPRPGAPSFIVYFCGGAGGDFDKQKFFDFVKNHQGEGLRTGFNLPFLVKREVFDIVGIYDIRYDPWSSSSDTDIQCKFELAGVKTYQNTNCLIYHFSQTSGTFHPDNHWNWSENYEYFRQKWGFERPGDPDVWFSKNLIKYDQLKYNPWWKDFYAKKISESTA